MYCNYCGNLRKSKNICILCKNTICELSILNKSCKISKICKWCSKNKLTCYKCNKFAISKCEICEVHMCCDHCVFPNYSSQYDRCMSIILVCDNCKDFSYIITNNTFVNAASVIEEYQNTQINEIKYVLTKTLEKYNIHDKLFVKHLVYIQAKLLHFNIKNLKL